MATLWDDSLKLLISDNVQDFVSLFMKGAVFKAKFATEFKGRELRADALIQVVPKSGEPKDALMQIEIQSDNDPDMRERLLEYNLRARREHKLPVYSYVVYLRDDGEVLGSPLQWPGLDGETMLDFRFGMIEVYKMTADEVRQLGLSGLLPLMILTKDGGTYEIAEEIFASLESAGKWDSIGPAYVLASLVLGKDNVVEQQLLLRRLHEMHEMLNESPVYAEMTRLARERGLEIGLQQGLQQGMQQGQLQLLRQMISDIVVEKFPDLIALAEEKIDATSHVSTLRRVTLKLSTAQTLEEAQQVLRQIPSDKAAS